MPEHGDSHDPHGAIVLIFTMMVFQAGRNPKRRTDREGPTIG